MTAVRTEVLTRVMTKVDREILMRGLSTSCLVCGEIVVGVYPTNYVVEDERRLWEKRTHRRCLDQGETIP